MSEINDLVLPVLKKIQSDLSEVKIDLGEVKQKLDTVEGYVTYHMGITFQHKADLEAMQRDIADLKKRLAVVEMRS
ncbi:MAG: hypothetical protein JO273_03240 [Methylobacteriaceae bacterium]|nr:hypothetical protein [Methylobacteriaceae bacterium]